MAIKPPKAEKRAIKSPKKEPLVEKVAKAAEKPTKEKKEKTTKKKSKEDQENVPVPAEPEFVDISPDVSMEVEPVPRAPVERSKKFKAPKAPVMPPELDSDMSMEQLKSVYQQLRQHYTFVSENYASLVNVAIPQAQNTFDSLKKVSDSAINGEFV